MGDSTIVEDEMAADSKVEPPREATPSSIESTPEPEAGAEPSQEPAQPQKRKGGRKPVCNVMVNIACTRLSNN